MYLLHSAFLPPPRRAVLPRVCLSMDNDGLSAEHVQLYHPALSVILAKL